jgi:broad specificity phosphatase PhoE
MPTRLTLVSSASTPATRAAAFPLDEGLDEYGRRDAAAMASEFQNVSVVFSSPARRARETVAALGLQHESDSSLQDIDLGSWAGRALSSVAETDADALASWLTDPASRPHGGETVEELCVRISAWLQAMSVGRGRIVAITHPAVIRAAILAAIHASPISYWYLDIAPLSVVELTSNGRRWALKSIRN